MQHLASTVGWEIVPEHYAKEKRNENTEIKVNRHRSYTEKFHYPLIQVTAKRPEKQQKN